MKREFNESEYARLKERFEILHIAEKEQAEAVLQEGLSFLKQVDFIGNPKEECFLYRAISFYYINLRDANRALEYVLKAQEIAEKRGGDQERWQVESTIAIVHSLKGDHLKAIDIWEDILSRIDSKDKLYIPILNNLVVAYGFSHQFTHAVDLSYKLLKTLEESNASVYVLSSAYINLGNSYNPLKKYDQAIKAFEHALELADEIGHYSHQKSIHGNLVGIYIEMGDLDKAYYHSQKEYETSQKMPGEIQKAEALMHMGDVTLRLQRVEESESYLLKSLEILQAEGNPVNLSDCLMALGRLHLAKNEPQKAIEYLTEAEPIVNSTSVDQLFRTFYLTMDDYYQQTQDYENARKYLLKLLELNNKEFTQLSENMTSVAEAEYLRHQIEKKNLAYQEQNEALQRSMDMLNRLISVLSHDVRGPIANSVQALRMLQEGRLSADTAQELLGHLVNSLESSSDLLAEMMLWIESRAFSKEVSRLLLNVDVPELLESVIRYYQGQLMQKELKLELDLPASPTLSYSEPNILKIAMRNILSNAIKYSQKGGNIYISLKAEADSILLKIRDEGIGMGEEELQKLLCEELKPRLGTDQELGMGMGLRLCFGYLQLLNIGYDIQSKEHQGTDFSLRLPPAKPEDSS